MSPTRYPKGIRRFPILGAWGNDLLFFLDPIAYIQHAYALAGPLAAGLQDQSPTWLIIASAELNRAVLTDAERFHAFFLDMPVPPGSDLLHLANGLLNMNGAPHRTYRQMLLPAFHRRAVAQSFTAMIELTGRMLASWHPDLVIDGVTAMRDLTLSIVAEVVFGLPLTEQPPALLRQIRSWVELFTAPSANLLPISVPGTSYRRLLRASDVLGESIRQLLAERRVHPTGGMSAFDLLAQAQEANGQPLSTEAVLGQASLLFTAGHETSANALVWMLVLLALHPYICLDLIDEITGLLGTAPPALEDLDRLPLLDRVVRESLRLLPPAVYGVRRAQEPLELGGYALPAGTVMIFSPVLTHRVSPVFEQPAQFRPKRWETISPDPYEYIPFGAGPRRCLGETFALQEIKTVLILLLQRFRPELVTPTRIDYRARITLSPNSAVPLRLRAHGARTPPVELSGSLRRLIDLPA